MDSNTENPDLEDGEIEDDEEEQNTVMTSPDKTATAPCQTIKSSSNRGRNDKGSRAAIVDDDFAGEIESMIAIALKKDGIEPPLPEISRNQEKENCGDLGSQRQSKRKKRGDNFGEREKKKKLDKTLMEAEEDEFEFLCVRGASPPPVHQQQPSSTYPGARGGGANDDSYDSDYSGSSYDSYSSPDRHRVTAYNDKRNRGNRDRAQRTQRSGGQKEKHHNKRHQSRTGGTGNGQNDLGLDSDDERNRKMELCKFYLMDCCAKRDKCLYMHSDFPCKYYYLGIRCLAHDKGTCKFLHGAPLTDNVRSILLKHLETAPKEILGDFPRLSRDNAIKMLDSTNHKLMIDYGLVPKQVVTPSNSNNPVVANKIPSLLEINIAKPASLIEKEENLMNKSLKPRRTRWCAPSSNTSTTINPPVPPSVSPVLPPPPVTPTKNSFLSLKFLTGVLSQTQIENLENLGIETLEQVNQLTVAQLNDLGLTVDQIRAIQLNAMNIQKLGLLGNSTSDSSVTPTTTSTTTIAYGDLDMRIAAPLISAAVSTTQSDSDMLSLNPGGGDVDMRVLSSEPSTDEKSPKTLDDNVTQSTQPTSINTDYSKFIISPPSSIDYSKYLKDSNLEHILENNSNSDSEEDENLKIDDELLASVTISEPPPSMTSPPIIPPICVTSLVPTKILPLLSAVVPPNETSSSPVKYLPHVTSSSTTNSSSVNISEITRIDFYSPRLSPTQSYSEELPSIVQTPLPTASPVSVTSQTAGTPASSHRLTIYDRIIDDDMDKQIKPDRDMRLQAFIQESSDSNGDIDFRLPFKPILNYVPATEIDASITSHSPIEYKLVKICIPKPDYSDIRRSFPIPNKTMDPRLRRIFALKEISDEKSYHDITSPTDPFQSSVRSPIDMGVITPRIDPRADPRRKKETASDSMIQIVTPTSFGSSAAGNLANKSLDIQIMLQNSLWYRDLSSKQKMSVNQHLATLSAELKQFHLDPNPDKKFDTNIIIQQTLTNLGVYVNDSGDFIELCDNTGIGHNGMMMNPMVGSGHKLAPNHNHIMNLMNLQGMDGGGGFGGMNPNMPNFNPHHPHPNMNQIQMFPSKQFGDGVGGGGGGSIRPGLLGIAPNMPFNYDSNLAFQQQTLQFEEFIDNNINNNRFDRGDGGGGNRNFNRNNNFRGGGNMRNNNDRWRNPKMNRNNNNNIQRRPMYDRDNRRHD